MSGAATVLTLAGCVANAPGQGRSDGIIAPVAVAGARAAPGPLAATLRLPPRPGLHPVVIVLHGCGGPSANQRLWANRLDGWGYGSLLLDSFSARGVRSVCAPDKQPLVTRFDRAGDVIAAARWLRTQPGVDAGRIVVLGESHGGGTAMAVASRPFEVAEDGLIKAVVNYYGPCRAPALHGTLPVLALAGTDDTWSRPVATCQAYAQAVAGEQSVSVQAYPGAVHGFDNPRLLARRWGEGHPMQYDATAAQDSFQRVHTFLDKATGSSTRDQ